mmetsp:Transcript_69620/g.110364  ORF Transcript_69620/g.110364 Transcript_69620/m.110364 type:complete len:496 (+) Transcript_69620:45-1532(+)
MLPRKVHVEKLCLAGLQTKAFNDEEKENLAGSNNEEKDTVEIYRYDNASWVRELKTQNANDKASHRRWTIRGASVRPSSDTESDEECNEMSAELQAILAKRRAQVEEEPYQSSGSSGDLPTISELPGLDACRGALRPRLAKTRRRWSTGVLTKRWRDPVSLLLGDTEEHNSCPSAIASPRSVISSPSTTPRTSFSDSTDQDQWNGPSRRQSRGNCPRLSLGSTFSIDSPVTYVSDSTDQSRLDDELQGPSRRQSRGYGPRLSLGSTTSIDSPVTTFVSDSNDQSRLDDQSQGPSRPQSRGYCPRLSLGSITSIDSPVTSPATSPRLDDSSYSPTFTPGHGFSHRLSLGSTTSIPSPRTITATSPRSDLDNSMSLILPQANDRLSDEHVDNQQSLCTCNVLLENEFYAEPPQQNSELGECSVAEERLRNAEPIVRNTDCIRGGAQESAASKTDTPTTKNHTREAARRPLEASISVRRCCWGSLREFARAPLGSRGN